MADWPLAQTDNQQVTQGNSLTSSEYGETHTASASTNTKGTWDELHSGVPFDVAGVYVQITDIGAAVNYLIDIGIGASTAEVVLIPNIACAAGRANSYQGGAYFPVRIAKGTRVSFRLQASTGSSAATVNVLFFSGGFGSDPGFSRVTAYNIDTSTSTANVAPDPGGSANTFSTPWTQVTASTERIRALIIEAHQGNATVTLGSWQLEVGTRISGTDTAILPGLILKTDVNYDQIQQNFYGPFPVNIPSASDLRIRVKSSITDATDRLFRVALYGMD